LHRARTRSPAGRFRSPGCRGGYVALHFFIIVRILRFIENVVFLVFIVHFSSDEVVI
jgi:hypothetical protein